MYWLTNNSLANTNKKIFRVKEKDIPDVMNQEEQTHFNPLHNFDAKKHGKKTFIGSLIATCVCVLSIVVLAFIPSVSIFNASEESNQYTRIEINSELVKNHYIFETNDSVISFFEEKYPDMKIADVSIKVEEEVILEDDDREYRPDIVYVSIKLDDKLANDYISSIQESLVTDLKALPNVDTDHLYVTFTTCESASVDYLLNSAIIFISLVAGLTLVFVTIRFGYTYGLATLATLIPASCISLGFYALTRIEISALSLAGIAGGLLIISISQMVLFERMKRLKRESRYKITTYEEREAIALKASKDTMFTVISILATAMVIVVVLALASPLKYAMISTYGILLLTIVIGGINTIFLLIPTYLFLEKRIHWSWSFDQEKRNKKRMEKAKEQNKNRGAEPREAIIPGIND
jgi:preprotein translocase subunit SecF